MTELLLIRHAETDLAGTFCGDTNPPVNATGRKQIHHLLQSLCATPPEAVFTSDLQRALDTAHAIAENFEIPCFTHPALREISFGRWEGLRWKEVEALDPHYASSWVEAFPHLPAPEGERFEDFEARVLAEIEQLAEHILFRSVAVVTHAGVIRTILRNGGVSDDEAWRLTKTYCSVVRLTPGQCARDGLYPTVQNGSIVSAPFPRVD